MNERRSSPEPLSAFRTASLLQKGLHVHVIDWVIVAIPLGVVFAIAMKARRHVKSVSDFLAAGRVAGRYIVCVAGAEAALGLVSLVDFHLFRGLGLWQFYNPDHLEQPVSMA